MVRKMAEIVKQDHSEKGPGVLYFMRRSYDLSGNLEEQEHLLDFEGHRQGEGSTVDKGLSEEDELQLQTSVHCDFAKEA